MKLTTDVKGRALPCEIYMDGYLKSNCDTLHQQVENNWDNIGFIAGYEGDGKSSLAQTMGLYFDAGLTLERIVFTPQQFFDAVDNAPPGSAVIWDEADDLGEQWYKDILQALKSKMKRIRKQNLHILLVTPTVFDLNKYFVIARTKWLLHVYAKELQRGYFRFFNRERKKELYLKGYRDWNWNAATPNFIGRFTKLPEGFPIDQEAYEDKKEAATQELEIKGGKSKKHALISYRKECLQKLYWIQKEYYGKNMPQALYGEVFGITQAMISQELKTIKEDKTQK